MPRNDDYQDDDRPRRRPGDDDEADEDRPRRRRPDDDDDNRPPPRKKGTGLMIGILVGVFLLCCGGGGTAVYLIYRGVKKTVEQVGTTMEGFVESEQSKQNLIRIGSAIQQYENANGAFPNNTYETRPKGTRPLLSWRVHILPYLGAQEKALYQQFKLEEPWDSPNNIRLVNQMPAIFGTPTAQTKAGPGKTFYRGFSHRGGMFEKPNMPGDQPPKITMAGIKDGTSSTILVVDAGEAVEWTKPDDIDFGPARPRPELGGAYPNVPWVMILMCDGTVRKYIKTTPESTLRMLADRQDGQVIPVGWEQP
jgi:hypothetical protein